MSAKIIDLSPYVGIISVTGPDALFFLQGQLTCDVREIGGQIQLAGFCTQKGRLRALFKLFKIDQIFYLILPKSLLSPILAQLKKIGAFSKVMIQEESDVQLIGWIATEPPLDVQDAGVNPITLLKAPGHLSRFLLIGSTEVMAPYWQTLSKIASPSDFSEWSLWDIRQGIPEVWLETTECFFPHHLRLIPLGGVSLTKGCYCGQEIVARMQYRGNIKRRTVYGFLQNRSDTMRPGTDIFLVDYQNDLAKIISATTVSGQTELLLEIPNAILPEESNIQSLKLRVGDPEAMIETLFIKPFHGVSSEETEEHLG